MKEKAYFVERPRRMEDLRSDNPDGTWREYRIVKTVCLRKIDFENFITDLLADRQFIEDNAALCVEDGDCILVTNRAHKNELLVMPLEDCFVRCAALYPATQVLSGGVHNS